MKKEEDINSLIKEEIKNTLYLNPFVNISIENYLYDIFLNKNIKKSSLDNAFNNSLYPILNSIKKNSLITYNMNDIKEIDTYFIEYLNVINKCILGFNSFLLQVVYMYCKNNNKNYYNDGKKLDEIFELGANKNSIEDLFKFLIKEKICYANQFFTYTLYENLFRNQFCHGWHNFFYFLLENNNKANPKWESITSKKKIGFLYDDEKHNFYDLRKNLKQNSIFNRKNIDIKEYLTLSSYLGTGVLEVKFNISLPYRKSYFENMENFEAGSTMLYIYDLNGEKSKKPDGTYWTIDLLNEFEKKENNNEIMSFGLSLNDLINNIKITISDLLESNLI